jgi:uncharacterized protein
MSNRLAHETSPYLLQHQNNPVDWYPWGPEALARAQTEQKPIFLSIGYSACHWCHVMEHESFENPRIAELMNQHYINIKVDREERPDLDAIYMQAVQLLTRRGGWPMSVFLTPDLQPFFGGTYWPPAGRMGMPGFDQVLLAVNEAWTHRRKQALEQAAEITQYLQQTSEPETSAGELSAELILTAAQVLERNLDHQHGGFGGAPKFPHPMDLRLLLRAHARQPRPATLQAVTLTLDKMLYGGIYDQLGGGFHRYSVDERWLVPHFEKMLYDNAQLTCVYVEAFQVTGNPEYARCVRETCDYVLRELTDSQGAFYSTEDADSEGEEGKFYVWTTSELVALLGEERARTFGSVYDVQPGGNFEGHSILNLPRSIAQYAALYELDVTQLAQELAECRAILFQARAKRIRPGLDDKVLVNWNGLMIEGLALAGSVLDEPRYLAAAEKAARFLWQTMRQTDGRLLHSWRGGVAKLAGYLDDYTAFANGLISLFEASGNSEYLAWAMSLCDQVLQHFADPNGGFFFTADDHEELLYRHKDLQDNAVPSGNSLAANAFIRLATLTGRTEYREAAIGTFRAGQNLLERYPSAAGQLLQALDFAIGPTPEVVLALPDNGAESNSATRLLQQHWFARRALTILTVDHSPGTEQLLGSLVADKQAINQLPTLYLCEQFTCQAPVIGVAAISASLGQE